MIEWLMQVVAVAWMGAMLIMLLKVQDDSGGSPGRGREPDFPRPGRRPLDVGRSPFRGSLVPARAMRPMPRAHRGNARELRAAQCHARHRSFR
jgi:hypothetical protein